MISIPVGSGNFVGLMCDILHFYFCCHTDVHITGAVFRLHWCQCQQLWSMWIWRYVLFRS